ncbi:MAG: translation initiation factor IF-3 [Clostridiales bacterium]|nr:translation initiation factor IF-3 [Clostridiales bacterium]
MVPKQGFLLWCAGSLLPAYFLFWRCIPINEILINEEIREKEVRVVSSTGEQLGVMATAAAIKAAEQQNLDLCMIAPKAVPPVCKIMDYGKYRFEMQKREKETKKNQKVISLHEIQLSVTIEAHDMEVKAKKAREFLKAGDRIKVSIRFRSRQIAHPEIGVKVMNDFFQLLSDVAKMEKKPLTEGRNMTMILVPLS